MSSTRVHPIPSGSLHSEPAWDVAYLFPEQGSWTEQQFLKYITKRGYELCDGRLEMLTMPTEEHQIIAAFLFQALAAFVHSRKLGIVLFAGLRVHTLTDKIREPDLAFMFAKNANRRGSKTWEGADLVMEVVSEDDPARDYQVKRDEYERAGIPEYWIVDPQKGSITILTLQKGAYEVHGQFLRGNRANAALLDGFSVDVTEALKTE